VRQVLGLVVLNQASPDLAVSPEALGA